MSDDQSTQRIRVACVALCRIRHSDGRYLLALNQNRLQANRYLYTAIGGALAYTAADILTRFEAVPEIAITRDLRLYIPLEKLEAFGHWVLQRRERETDAYRELCEELVEEMRVLPHLDRSDLKMDLITTIKRERITDRDGVQAQLTHYWIEMFDVAFINPQIRAQLLEQPLPHTLRLVSESEIHAGETQDGMAVDAGMLLLPDDSLGPRP